MILKFLNNKVKDVLIIGDNEILREIPEKINVEFFFDSQSIEEQNFFERFDACVLDFKRIKINVNKNRNLFLEIYNSLKPFGIFIPINQNEQDEKQFSIFFQKKNKEYRKPLNKGIFSFGFLKPDIMERRESKEKILKEIGEKMKIIKLKEMKITKEIIEKLYFESLSAPHFNLLYKELFEKTSLFFIVKGKNAVSKLNNLVGITDPKFAKEGTLRNNYGIDILKNSIHSANINRINREIFYIFPEEYEKIMKNERKN